MLERIYASGKVEDASGTSFDAFPAGLPREHAEEIARLVRSGGFRRSLETGMAYGLSTLAICSASEGPHIAIDPFQSSDWRSIGMLNVKRAGFADRVRLVEARSDEALPRLVEEGVRLDFALIDGLHLFDATLLDFHYIDRMLDVGGVVVFHDTWMPAVEHAVAYVRANRAYSDVPTCDGLAALRKEDEDARAWDFHREFAGRAPSLTLERVRGAIGTRRRRLETHPLRTRLAGSRVAPSIDSRISPRDEMYAGDGKHYFSVGLSAMQCIEAAGVTSAKRVLDMPCGHGRVMRFLARRFPEAELVACDLNSDGVAFCASRFGATPVVSSEDLTSLSLPGPFDLIWCGSLVTHLDADASAALLSLFARSLAPDGVAVVTTHGSLVAERLRAGDRYQLAPEAARAVVTAYEAEGFGYAGYPWSDGYGVSLSSRSWIERTAASAGLRETFFGERLWDGHQDVVALSRVG